MEKLLHERLKELPEGSFYDELGETLGLRRSDEELLGDYWDRIIPAIADEIERCYIPLPCDPEGKPWMIGDPVNPLNAKIDSHVTGYIYDGEDWYLQYKYGGRDDECDELAKNCKRPQPKVLDVDGMETKEGDTVWDIKHPTHKKHTVIEVIPEDGCVICEDKLTYTAELLTHKEPDSLEKLQRDIANHWSASISAADRMAFHEWADRLSALIERGA